MRKTLIRMTVPAMILIAILAVAVIPPAGAAGTESCTKSYHVVLELGPAGVTEQAVQLVYAYNPLPVAKSGDLKAVVATAGGQPLVEFYLHDPRNQFGDVIVVDRNGTPLESRGIATRENSAVLSVRFPQQPGAASFLLYDNNGTLLKTVDLAKASDRTNWNCTPDYGIVRKNNPAPPIPFVLGGIGILAIAAGAGWYFLKKKKTGGTGE